MLIKNLTPYEKIDGKFIVKFKKPVQKYTKGYAFQLRVGDPSGEIMLRYWGPENQEEVEKLYNSIKKDDVIYVVGETTIYNGRIAINVNPPEGKIQVLQADEYDKTDFIPESDKDTKEMYAELLQIADSIENTHLKELVYSFIKDPAFSEKFTKHPAAMYRHHGWLGGLLEHTLNVVKICDFLKKLHPELNRDLMITGAILHDIGKIKELDVTTHIRTSVEGMLIGHLALTYEEVSKKMDLLKTPEDLKIKVKHMILSHHGKIEYGSPKQPAIPEALAVYLADEIDAKITEMITYIKRAETEDDYIYLDNFGTVYLK
ncbi:MAG: HD domain-containing protein [Candidatus Aenigmatarchaeota archaeon]